MCTAARDPGPLEDPLLDQVIQVPRGRLLGDSSKPLILGVADPRVRAHEVDRPFLALAQIQRGQNIGREPVAPQRLNERASVLPELGFGEPGFAQARDHVERPRAGPLDVAR